MKLKNALILLSNILHPKELTNIQEIVFIESWSNITYEEIAEKTGYNSDYIKEVGCHLWQILSDFCHTKVTKSNFKSVLKKYEFSQSNIDYQYFREKYYHLHTISNKFFVGRSQEIIQLKKWILLNKIQLITIYGIAGIGKTSLVNKLVAELENEFDFIFYTNLIQNSQLENVLSKFIKFTLRINENNPCQNFDYSDLINQSLEIMLDHRCLLIFDGLESIFYGKSNSKTYQYQQLKYNYLFENISQIKSKSHLLLIGRNNISFLGRKNSNNSSIHSLFLSGLSCSDANKIIIQQGLSSSLPLVTKYSGNPLFIEYAASTIKSLFDGDIEAFLRHNILIYGEIYHLLQETLNSLSNTEKLLINYLAANETPPTFNTIMTNLSPEICGRKLLENLESLQMRSLITIKEGDIILEPLIREYINLEENER